MLNVNIGINKVSATLSERVTISAPFYILKLIKQEDNTFQLISVLDSAPFSRVNQLTLELVISEATEDLPNGLVFLTGGTYKYEFYQSDTSALVITDNKLLESGLLKYDTQLQSTQYNTINIEKTYGA